MPYRLGLVVALVIGSAACRERPGEEAGIEANEPAAFTFTFDAEIGLEYADLGGHFRFATRAAAVPMASRRVVRVIEPTVQKRPASDDRPVHIVDLRRASGSDSVTTRLVSRDEFERRALAALPPGAASRVQIPGAGPELQLPIDWSHGRVIVYATTWCGACKQAREFFRERGLEFVERNVEHDAEAAAELASKATAVGLPADRVPVIDVRGRLLVGFDQARLETLLGESV